MLACLPRPGDLPLQLLPHMQMNTGLQKWDTTQRMRSFPFPTPAELDAYAKKVAHNPLTIKIFPNSIKVPQRNHVRRTVNGLDTSGQRYSPYPSSQPSAKTGLLAIVKGPTAKSIIKDFEGGRTCLHPEVIMNTVNGSYQVASTSTLNHHPTPNLSRTQQNLAIQQQEPPQPLQMPLHPQPSHVKNLRHPPSITQHSQGPPRPKSHSQQPALSHQEGPSTVILQQQQQHLQQHLPPGLQGNGKLHNGNILPNVSVSTSTIPLSMLTGLHHGHPADLSIIVHQINQFCQAQTHGGGTISMCEGQIANQSPVSHNLLITACPRGTTNNNPATPGFPTNNCAVGPIDNATAPSHMNHLPSNHSDVKQQQHLQNQPPQLNAQQVCSWNQNHFAHLPNIQNNGTLPCKQPSRDPTFQFKSLGYPADMCVGHPFTLKPPVERPTPSPPVNNTGLPTHITHYSNGHYFHSQIWNSGILPTPNSDSSGSQDIAMPFHSVGLGGCTTLDCGAPGALHYRLGSSSSTPSVQNNPMQTSDYMGGDFQAPYFRDQNLGLMGNIHRPPLSRVGPEVGDGRTGLLQHPGYR